MLISSGSARDWHFGQRNVASGFKHDAHATPDDATTPDADAADEKEDIPKASTSTYCLTESKQSSSTLIAALDGVINVVCVSHLWCCFEAVSKIGTVLRPTNGSPPHRITTL